MSTLYTREEAQATFHDYFRVSKLYQSKFVNWKGLTKDTGEPLSEIIAKELSTPRYIELLKHIADYAPKRKSSYKRDHKGKLDTIPENTHIVNEKRLAIALYNTYKEANKESCTFGKIIDYQVPLKDIRKDKAGEIDLIAHNQDTGELTLIELKQKNSEETFLRAVLEIFTYFMIVKHNRIKLLEDFKDDILNPETKLIPAILIHSESHAAKTAKDLPKYPCQSRLMEELVKIMCSPLHVYFHDYDNNDVRNDEFPEFKNSSLIRPVVRCEKVGCTISVIQI